MEVRPRQPSANNRDLFLFGASMLFVFVPIFIYTWLRGEGLHVLHYTDENLHFQLISIYSQGTFIIDGEGYATATTPFFHLTLATVDHLFGGGRWLLRACNLFITLILPLLIFRDLSARGSRVTAWLFSWVILSSPYMGSRGFVLLTENYSYLWLWLALRPVAWKKREDIQTSDTLKSALFLALAALTRQNLLWIVPWFLSLILWSRWQEARSDPRAPLLTQWRQILLLAWPYAIPLFACLPFFLAWRGLVPSIWRGVNQADSINLKAMAFTIILLGLYASFLTPTRLLHFLSWRRGAVALLSGGFISFASGMRHESLFTDSGHIWLIADHFPNVLGANGLLMALACIGSLELRRAWHDHEYRYLGFILLFAASFCMVRMNFQKYFEVTILFVILLEANRMTFRSLDRLCQILWITAGLVYLLSKLGKLAPPMLDG
jgi:hypothetical protein